ncbi:MAG: peptide chain release factor N(5)-glutamine methyltransferase [Saprospiraceae bacterium]|nr:peptide chain release factor N(5)-glutamine methyltransferase [Saprospiraceae bacterium]MDW8228316.1 peptide chain release factor N(5)-glutamine methyltransferase [Saprospiraceae bacterium]
MEKANAFERLVHELSPRHGLGEARSIARIVFADALGYRTPPATLSVEEEARLEPIRRRLLAGEPVQYVLGQADFFGLKFRVNSSVLIPRQETEELVAFALRWLNAREQRQPAVLDVGLGSGCIGIALKRRRPDVRLFGIEKSPDALAVALENAYILLGKGEFTFCNADILQPETVPAHWPAFDLILSNPPYVRRQEQHLMPEHVLAHEPHEALFVEDDDPLLFYRAIARFAQQRLTAGGALFFECNEFNAWQVVLLLEEMGFSNPTLQQDLSGAERMAWAVRKN